MGALAGGLTNCLPCARIPTVSARSNWPVESFDEALDEATLVIERTLSNPNRHKDQRWHGCEKQHELTAILSVAVQHADYKRIFDV